VAQQDIGVEVGHQRVGYRPGAGQGPLHKRVLPDAGEEPAGRRPDRVRRRRHLLPQPAPIAAGRAQTLQGHPHSQREGTGLPEEGDGGGGRRTAPEVQKRPGTAGNSGLLEVLQLHAVRQGERRPHPQQQEVLHSADGGRE
jgi:hypothetical protein